jgi:hypothetical protein
MLKKILLLAIIPVSLYSQKDFLKNFYDFDTQISRQDVITALSKYSNVRQVVDSVNWIAFEGIEWREYKNLRLGVEFIEDTISICWLGITDSISAINRFEDLMEFFESNLKNGYSSAKDNDPDFLRLRRWRQKESKVTTNLIQLSVSKKEPHKISILNFNITWLMESRKKH